MPEPSQGTLLEQGCLGKCFPRLSWEGTEGPGPLWSKGTGLHFELSAELGDGIIHIVIVLLVCRLQELWAHEDLHQGSG